ncbi:MAG: DUF4159 domain-containing protein [Verrucomicrobiae bacterium]|nr:DUF4159 domain-containing protein [Verrucomicrobiae bacterium]NNJ43903.1 DUF4159 domain-containing protein [Akkermansiaceae bacterium]
MRQKNQSKIPDQWIDEIPTRASVFKSSVVSVAALMLLGLGFAAWKWGPPVLAAFLAQNPSVLTLWEANGTAQALEICFLLFGVMGGACALSGILSLVRNRVTYQLLRVSMLIVYLAVSAYVYFVWQGVSSILDEGLEVAGAKQDGATTFKLWWKACWPALAVALYGAWLHAMIRSRSVFAAFTRVSGHPMVGDRVLEDIRTHGRDPRHRRSLYASSLTHLLIIVIIPYILSLGGCVEAYRVPKGSGNPVVAMVKVVKPKKKKKKTLSLRPNSAIIFDQPDLDNTEVDEQLKEQTQVTYSANTSKAGKMGKGGGTKGGWPEGMDGYKIRFIRLDHGGSGWDDGMNQTGADINFLRAFAQATGFKKIARKGESHSIALLKKYPKDGFPPFVYMTGNDRMGRVSTADIKILRDYCINGGMLIADAGHRNFHHSFIHFIRQVFPDKTLLDIPDDDMLYQLPNGFPEGAPAFWHHGGRRALGIKHDGRWIAFYHPGDMNDAWKSQNYTDVTPEMRDAAMNLGINLIYYSFTQWNDTISKNKK